MPHTHEVNYEGSNYILTDLNDEMCESLSEDPDYLKEYFLTCLENVERLVEKISKAAFKNAAAALNTGSTGVTPSPSNGKAQNQKRKYTCYRKMEIEQDQDRLDELLVTLVMDKPQISNPRIGAEYRTKEKVAMAWIEIQHAIREDFPNVDYSIDDLKGRWTSIKGAYMGRKKNRSPQDQGH